MPRPTHDSDPTAGKLPTMPVRQFSIGNRRRRTQANRVLAWIGVPCLALALLVHCAPSIANVPPRAKLVPAVEHKSAVPTLEQVRKINADADQRGASASGKVTSAKSGMVDAQAEIQSLAGEVSRLHKQKSATENELLAVYNRLVEQERKFAVMVNDLSAAENDLSAERALRLQAGDALVAAQSLASQKDAEATQLRAQLAHESLVADNYAQSADANAKLAAEHAKRADQAAGKIKILGWFLIGTAILCLISIAINLIQLRGRFPL